MGKKPVKPKDRHLGVCVAFYLPVEWRAAIDVAAGTERLNRSDLIRKMIRFYLEEHDYERPDDNWAVY